MHRTELAFLVLLAAVFVALFAFYAAQGPQANDPRVVMPWVTDTPRLP